MSRFRGKSVVITGAASGLGRGMAETLARRGAAVVLSDCNVPALESVAAGLEKEGCRVYPLPCDVTSPAQVRRLYTDAERLFGPLDYSFANAGFAMAGLAQDLACEHYEEVLAVDLTGAIRCCQEAYQLMVPRRSGHVITTASLAGLIGFPGMTPYSVAKAAVVRYSLDLRLEARAHGVRVTALCPAFIQTGIFSACRSVRIETARIRETLPMPIAPLEPSVRALLRGVEQNRAVVTYPWYATALWWVQRLSLPLSQPLLQLILDSVQRARR